MSHDLRKYGKNTQAIHAGQHVDEATGAVAPPHGLGKRGHPCESRVRVERWQLLAEGYVANGLNSHWSGLSLITMRESAVARWVPAAS